MIIYRYENKNTGDGPFLSFEGVNPSDNKIYNNGYLYGCKTKKELIAYMKEHNKYNLKNYHIAIYNIPDKEVIIRKREVLFPKQYSLFYKEPVSTIPQAFWAGEQDCYQHTVAFQETKCVKCRNGFLPELGSAVG